jgi:hypothetical protein
MKTFMAKKNLVYNVSNSVGKRGANTPEDVLLVRFLLRRICELPHLNSPYKNLPIVSTFDNTLGDAILWFQQCVRSRGKSITVDGQIDPAPKGDGLYTIIFLNGNYWKYYPQHRHYIEADPLFPSQLIEHFNREMPIYL